MKTMISEITTTSTNIYRITVQVPKGECFDYQPGDYVFITLDGYEPRPYSIANAPRPDNTLDFYVKRGFGLSAALCDDLTVCHSLEISQPHHQFDFCDDHFPIDFIAGGMGITPFLSMIENHNSDQPKLRLYWGVESENDLYFTPFLEEQRLRLGDKFDIIITITAQGGNIINRYFETCNDNKEQRHIYLSGPKTLVQESVTRLLAKGIKNSMIHYDIPTN